MKAERLLWVFFIVGFAAGGHSPAFADDNSWWQQFLAPSQNSSNTSPAVPPNATPEQAAALTANQQSLREDVAHLNAAYDKFRQNQAAGVDTTADLQNIRTLQQTLRNRQSQVRQQIRHINQPLLMKQKETIRASKQNLAAAHQQYKLNKLAGVDTTADLQALQNAKQTLRNDMQTYRDSGGRLSRYNGRYEDRNYRRSRYR